MSDIRWTIGDMEVVEQLAGVDFGDLQDVVKAGTVGKRLRAVAALVYVQEHKHTPDLTFDAMLDLTAEELVVRAQPLLDALAGAAAPLPR